MRGPGASSISKAFRWMSCLLVLVIVGQMGADAAPVALGHNECKNIRNEPQTCGYLQFCSDDPLNKGCRNCSDIYEQWCDDMEQFREKFPACEILCERKRLEELTTLLQSRESDLKRTQAQKEKLEQELQEQTDLLKNAGKRVENLTTLLQSKESDLKRTQAQKEDCSKLKWSFIGVSTAELIVILGLAAAATAYFWRQRRQRNASGNATTLDQEEEAIPLQTSQQEETPLHIITTPEDSGRDSFSATDSNSNGNGSGSSSTLSDMRAPTGGTDHHIQDASDFLANRTPELYTATPEAAPMGNN